MNYKKIRFSPEIEVETEKSIICKVKGWDSYWDASLREFSPQNRHHLYFNQKTKMELKKVLNNIKKAGGKSVTAYCGLHIHIDIKNMSSQDIVKIVKNFYKHQKYILKKFKTSPQRQRCYCGYLPERVLNITENIIENCRKQGYYFDIPASKSYALNLANLYGMNTLEFRFFNSTLNYPKFIKYVEWILKFVAYGELNG